MDPLCVFPRTFACWDLSIIHCVKSIRAFSPSAFLRFTRLPSCTHSLEEKHCNLSNWQTKHWPTQVDCLLGSRIKRCAGRWESSASHQDLKKKILATATQLIWLQAAFTHWSECANMTCTSWEKQPCIAKSSQQRFYIIPGNGNP